MVLNNELLTSIHPICNPEEKPVIALTQKRCVFPCRCLSFRTCSGKNLSGRSP